MKAKFLFASIFLCIVLIQTVARAEVRYLVFAAASLREVLMSAAERYQAECNCRIVFSFAGSSVLARQIDAGAPADLFISANRDWIDWLEERDRIVASNVSVVVGNRLVIAVARGSTYPSNPLTLLEGGRFAMGDPTGVPAGIYARETLKSLEYWHKVKSNAVFSENVRVTLEQVARGDVAAGIVYQSDILVEPRVKNIYEFPKFKHLPIEYVAAITGRSGKSGFLEFLLTDEGQALFEKFGFERNRAGLLQ